MTGNLDDGQIIRNATVALVNIPTFITVIKCDLELKLLSSVEEVRRAATPARKKYIINFMFDTIIATYCRIRTLLLLN